MSSFGFLWNIESSFERYPDDLFRVPNYDKCLFMISRDFVRKKIKLIHYCYSEKPKDMIMAMVLIRLKVCQFDQFNVEISFRNGERSD